jgi:hypothetical protein
MTGRPPAGRRTPARPNDPVGWQQWALDDLAEKLALSLTEQRLLRRLTLDAHHRDHTVVIGSRTDLAARLRLGAAHGRSTAAKALGVLEAVACVAERPGGLLEVLVYDELVCRRRRLRVDDLRSATWIRPAALDRVADKADLPFVERALLEVMLTLAGDDGVVPGSARDIARAGRARREAILALTSAGLVERVDGGWRIVDYAEIVWTPAERLDDRAVDLTAAAAAGDHAALQARIRHLETELATAALLLDHAIVATDPATGRWLQPIAARLHAAAQPGTAAP